MDSIDGGALQQLVTTLQANGQLLAAIQQAIKNAAGTYYLPGAWTPTLKGDGTAGAPTYTVQVGAYEQIGRRVVATFNVAISAVGGMTGNLLVGGLPLLSANTANDLGVLSLAQYQGITLTGGYTQLAGIVNPSSQTAKLMQSGSAVTPAAIAIGSVAATTQLVGVISYHV